ncbi:hypothetical protein RND81_06G011600 [Saponaria officinalis]|uniref:Ion transport domain-containing protein n=1 Tax=Saponaria officinalis TaxID=3572 RepID=A0AAW1K367_SAPOF
MAFAAIFGTFLGLEFVNYEDCKLIARRVWTRVSGMVYPYDRGVQVWNKLFCMSCLIALFLDPLIFFSFFISKEGKCLAIDGGKARAMLVIRSFTDIMYLIHILLQFRLAYVDRKLWVAGARDWINDPKKVAMRYVKGYFIVDIFSVLPFPQIIVLYYIPIFFHYSKDVLGVGILLQYILRLFRFFPLVAGQSQMGFLFESTSGNLVINFLTFLLSGHVVGSMWYMFGLQRLQDCLEVACGESGMQCFLDCSESDEYGSMLRPKLMQWRSYQNASACFIPNGKFGYGIFSNSVNLIGQPNFTTKYVYSLFWGFQQISTLAGNQVPSDDVFEVLFTTFIIGVGLILFGFLIGNMHLFIHSVGHRRLEMTHRRRDIERWMIRRGLPEDLKRQIREVEILRGQFTEGLNEEKLLESFPEELQREIFMFF